MTDDMFFISAIRFMNVFDSLWLFSGHGVDCHRTYEAILAGTTPILWNHTGLWSLFKQLPAVVLNSETEKKFVDKKALEEYELPVMQKHFLLAEYWFVKIDAVKKRYRK